MDDGILPSLAHRNPVAASLGSVTFTYDRVFRALMKLPLKYSKTQDNLPAIFLKSIAGGIAFPLSYLFNMSMKCGRVPSDWKIAYVCPIFKKVIAIFHLTIDLSLLQVFVARLWKVSYLIQ